MSTKKQDNQTQNQNPFGIRGNGDARNIPRRYSDSEDLDEYDAYRSRVKPPRFNAPHNIKTRHLNDNSLRRIEEETEMPRRGKARRRSLSPGDPYRMFYGTNEGPSALRGLELMYLDEMYSSAGNAPKRMPGLQKRASLDNLQMPLRQAALAKRRYLDDLVDWDLMSIGESNGSPDRDRAQGQGQPRGGEEYFDYQFGSGKGSMRRRNMTRTARNDFDVSNEDSDSEQYNTPSNAARGKNIPKQTSARTGGTPRKWRPLADIYDDKDTIHIYADLPGVSKDDVEIQVWEGNRLVVSGERKM
ncbi:hypothetical protein HK104_006653, partial [Borealophlyctis nickersoniae]